jgi:hypothetical protein
MSKGKNITVGTVADAIRAEIDKIPQGELVKAKPGRVLPQLEALGFEITASVRTATSKLLTKAKEMAEEENVISFDPNSIQTAERTECAMRLIEACGGNFEVVRAEIARLEQFARRIKGA